MEESSLGRGSAARTANGPAGARLSSVSAAVGARRTAGRQLVAVAIGCSRRHGRGPHHGPVLAGRAAGHSQDAPPPAWRPDRRAATRCSPAATAGDLPCVTGLPTYRRWRAASQCVPRPRPRRTRTRTTVRLTRKRHAEARAHGFRPQLTAAAAAVRPNAEARSQVRPDSGICRRSWPSTRPTTTDDDPIAAATCARPGQITLSRTCPGSASSAGPFSAASSTSTSGLHRSPGPGPVAEFWNPTGLAAA